MKISMVQCELYPGDPEKNYALIEDKIKEATEDEPDVIILPEMWNTTFFPEHVKELADQDGERTQNLLSRLAKELQVNIVGGSVARKSDDLLYNTSYSYNRAGELVGDYDKVHLFSPSGEDDIFENGDQLTTFKFDGVKCGVITCYDVRFPEWVRKNALEDIQILFVPAAWPEVRTNHWVTLNRARAIENQFFVVHTNVLGENPSGKMGGHSAIIDPWGEYVVEPQAEKGIYSGEVDLSVIKNIRESINVFRDRKPGLYE